MQLKWPRRPHIDYSANIIISSKINSYAPYKAGRLSNIKNSYKKIDPIHLKIFGKRKQGKLYAKNQKINLCLQGGQVAEQRKVSSKSLINNDQEICSKRAEKRLDFIPHLEPNLKGNLWPFSTISDQQQLKSTFYFHANQSNTKVQSRQLTRKSSENLPKNEPEKEDSSLKFNKRKYKSVKIHIKKGQDLMKERNTNEIPKKKPLFYLQPKEISNIKADSFIVTQYPSGQLVMGSYYRKIAEIASLTKIMTFYTIHSISQQFQKNLTAQIIEVDEEASVMSGTTAEIFMGDCFTVEQLLYGLMLPSGNDAAMALAKWGGKLLLENQNKGQVGQTPKIQVKRFVQEMNLIAKKLNLRSTRFGNPHGLPHHQSGSSAQDISLLIHHCLGINLFRKIVKTRHFQCWVTDTENVKRQVVWENTNKLLRRKNFIGVKTGVTITAGPCLATCYEVEDKIFIIVLFRTSKLSRRFKETRWILGLALGKLDRKKYAQNIRQILKNDPQLDSDNSEDEEQFNYDRSDAKQMKKRNKILTFQM